MFPHQTHNSYLSCLICIPHEFVSTPYGMIQLRRYAVMSFVCTKHSICIVTICIYVSAPNSRYLCVPHNMHPARVRFDTIRNDTISSRPRYETICGHGICLDKTLDMYCNDMYLYYRTKYSILVCPA